MNTYDHRIDELFSTITDLSHVQNINREAFNDISKVLLSFHDIELNLNTKTVCDASMGHGKSSVLVSYLKWITQQKTKTPLLIAIKEKQLAHEIYTQVSRVSPNSIVNIDSDNKNLYEADLINYQIVIIQHQRLKNLALGFGNVYDYQYFTKDKATWGISNQQEKIKRKLIIDEKPDFVDSVIFDINSINNVLDWFEDLAEPLKLTSSQIQNLKFYIMLLLGEQTVINISDHTTSLLTNNDVESIRGKNLLSILKQMKEHDGNKTKYDSLNKLKHFSKLLKVDNYGRIDDYNYNKAGRKIIISKLIDYSNIDMHLLVFDGTARANGLQYGRLNYKWAKIDNRNDYSRLSLHIDKINTTKYSRSKEGKPTQKAISKRIRELRQSHDKLFVLPTKDEISIYISEYAIKENEKDLYFDNELNHTKGINILNTTGKNFLKDYNNLYLTCLPKRNADYYKCLAIAFFGDDVLNLVTNNDSDNGEWFQDSKLELIYTHDLYSEILQIIHRSALRIIDNKQPIHIYLAYEEEKDRYNYDGYRITPISEFINTYYLKGNAKIEYNTLTDMSLYGRDKKIEGFAELIKQQLQNVNELTVNKIGLTFSNYIKKHWESQKDYIIGEFSYHGINIYIDESDKRKTKKVKLL